MKTRTAAEIVRMGEREHPGVVYRAAKDGKSVAAWHGGRWVPVASLTIMGEWCAMTMELLVDGKPAFSQGIYGEAPKA